MALKQSELQIASGPFQKILAFAVFAAYKGVVIGLPSSNIPEKRAEISIDAVEIWHGIERLSVSLFLSGGTGQLRQVHALSVPLDHSD